MMDTGGDKKVSKAEWDAFFTLVDGESADKSLTKDEWKRAGAAERIFDQIDVDHNGKIDVTEWDNVFKAVDKNNDKEITNKEWDEWKKSGSAGKSSAVQLRASWVFVVLVAILLLQ